MNASDRSRLGHMLNAAQDIAAFSKGETRISVEHDRKLAAALLWSIGVIGEAASKVSRDFQDANPQIAWAQIVGMRNRLVHGYFEIDFNILWDTVNVSIPPLVAQLEEVLTREDD
jgi:uncharacterized protein with HEPN domain